MTEIAPECDTLSKVQGMWWGLLEEGQCLQDSKCYYGEYKNPNYSYTLIEDTDTYLREYHANLLDKFVMLLFL